MDERFRAPRRRQAVLARRALPDAAEPNLPRRDRSQGPIPSWRAHADRRDLRDLAVVGPAGGDAFGSPRAAAMQEHHVRVLGADLVEGVPDARDIVAVGAA